MQDITKIENFRFRRHRPRPKQWTGIVLHWTASLDGADDVVQFTGRPSSKGWYHYILDRELVAECVDPDTHRAAHAGAGWNERYIGVASAHPIWPGFSVNGVKDRHDDTGEVLSRFTREDYDAAMERWAKVWQAKGYGTQVEPYKGNGRLTPSVFSLDKEHARELVELTAWLCERHNIPKTFYASARPSGLSAQRPQGVCCHHNISRSGKWDCIPWLPTLRAEFAAAGFAIID